MVSDVFFRGKVLAQKRIVQPWLMFDFIFRLTKGAEEESDQKKNLHEFTRKILHEKRQERAKGNKSTKSLLDKMIQLAEENPDFTDEDIINEVCTFMLAVSRRPSRLDGDRDGFFAFLGARFRVLGCVFLPIFPGSESGNSGEYFRNCCPRGVVRVFFFSRKECLKKLTKCYKTSTNRP